MEAILTILLTVAIGGVASAIASMLRRFRQLELNQAAQSVRIEALIAATSRIEDKFDDHISRSTL